MRAAATGVSQSLLRDKAIAIAGAGPSGLTAARLLQMAGADVQVYESDASPRSREQGGELDLHEDSGQVAMRKAGLLEQFLALSRPEGQSSRVYDRHGHIHVDFGRKQETITRPEIERGALRELLLGSLAPGTVQWGRRLQHVERGRDRRLRLLFEDGATQAADLVVGCDGTWSKVRPFVSPTKPYYSGITLVESRVASVEARHPEIAELVGPGIIMATGNNRAILAQQNGDGHVRIYLTLRVPEDWTQQCGLDFDRAAATREGLLRLFAGWSPRVMAMLTESDDFFIPRPLYTLPPRQDWHPQPDATLLGDAAHVMPPFTGKGANLAMLDAVELADHLTSGRHVDIPSALRAYEQAMLARMAKAITETLNDQDVLIAPDAPQGVADMFKRRIEKQREARARTV